MSSPSAYFLFNTHKLFSNTSCLGFGRMGGQKYPMINPEISLLPFTTKHRNRKPFCFFLIIFQSVELFMKSRYNIYNSLYSFIYNVLLYKNINKR